MTRSSIRIRQPDRSGDEVAWRRAHWCVVMLPAGLWLLAGSAVLKGARVLLRAGLLWPGGVFVALRLSALLSRAGFHSWRFWGGKWR